MRNAFCALLTSAGLVAPVAAFNASSNDYESWTAAEKQKYLWDSVLSDTTSGSFMNPVLTLMKIGNHDNLWAMTKIHADWREAGHQKCTHGIGAHAMAHFEWDTNEYTGMFQRADHCVIRMANAAAPGGIAMTAYGPNMAVKCLNDGAESANLQFIWQVDGYGVIPEGLKATKTCSYFETPISNHNPERDNIEMQLKATFIPAFNNIDPHSMLLGVSQMATVTQDGSKETTPRFPFALVLKPAPGLNEVPCTFDEPISQLLNAGKSGLAAPGKTLYEVYAVKDPSESLSAASLQRIGKLVLDSTFSPGKFGDHSLFFRHTFFEEELKLLRSTDAARAQQWSNYVDNKANYKQEGANLYWPFLPGGQHNDMLPTDAQVIV